ncbi:hypothetical protein ACOSQ2_005343 [Xanthoceras sorbifolium]
MCRRVCLFYSSLVKKGGFAFSSFFWATGDCVGKFLRLRVVLDITKPLRRACNSHDCVEVDHYQLTNAARFDYGGWLRENSLRRVRRAGPAATSHVGTKSGGSTKIPSAFLLAGLRQRSTVVRPQSTTVRNLEPGHQLSSDEQGTNRGMQCGSRISIPARQLDSTSDVPVISKHI